jgi:DNA-binding MarR family transcriptional regulator
VSTLANALVGEGMLARSPGSSDRRTVEYTLTPAGLREVTQWRATNCALLQNAIEALSGRDLRLLSAAVPVLDRLIAVIDAQSEDVDQAHDQKPA